MKPRASVARPSAKQFPGSASCLGGGQKGGSRHAVYEGAVCRPVQGSGGLHPPGRWMERAQEDALARERLGTLRTGGCRHSGHAHLAPGTRGVVGTSSFAAQRPAGQGATHLLPASWAEPRPEFRELPTALPRAWASSRLLLQGLPGHQLPSSRCPGDGGLTVPPGALWLRSPNQTPQVCTLGVQSACHAPSPTPIGSQRATRVPCPRRGPFKCSPDGRRRGQH